MMQEEQYIIKLNITFSTFDYTVGGNSTTSVHSDAYNMCADNNLMADLLIGNMVYPIGLCKDYKKMTCKLMTALFTEQEMVNSHVTGKRLGLKSGETRTVLNQDKVSLIVDLVKSHFSFITEPQIRRKMSQKCKDLRIAQSKRIKRNNTGVSL
ncbi:uncharacterized protein LOC143247347 [Tachypleus tridentatus]|uniref:uncharacterized protein LOC143247022 n=1 Tax=Tachypleus tridentatus TaxID=6853 RepID=UPI003FD22570